MRRALTIVITASLAAPASAGLWQDIYRGLDIIATPVGSPVQTTGNGTRVNGARSGRLRIVPNEAGRGHRLELDATFGVDSAGRPEIINFGGVELELSGAIQATAGYETYGYKTGQMNFTANNLQYSLRSTTGGENVELRGTLNARQELSINQFGFYTLVLNVDNSQSEIAVDGVAKAEVDTDFTIGPISVQGNIFYDGFMAVLNALGVDTSGLQQFTAASPIDRIVAGLTEQMGGLATGGGLEQLLSGATARALVPDAVSPPALTGGAFGTTTAASEAGGPGVPVPEPATLLVMVLGGAVYGGMRRRG